MRNRASACWQHLRIMSGSYIDGQINELERECVRACVGVSSIEKERVCVIERVCVRVRKRET